MIDISIIIPAYNSLDLFKKALFSVINQQNIIIEVIVVDDSTNSEINDYVKKLNSDKIQYYRNIARKGPVYNWNYGLTFAKGTYITVLHHDEYYEDPINQLSNILNDNKGEFEVLVSRVLKMNSVNSVHLLPVSKLNKNIKNFIIYRFPSFLFFYNFLGPVSCVIFKNCDEFLFNINLNWYVDVDWYFRLFKNKKIKYFDNYNILSLLNHNDKITSNIDIQHDMNNDYRYLYKYYIKYPIVLSLISLNFSSKKIKFKLIKLLNYK